MGTAEKLRLTDNELADYLERCLDEAGFNMAEVESVHAMPLACPCPRCGGRLEALVGPSGYGVTCENGDVKMTVRGI